MLNAALIAHLVKERYRRCMLATPTNDKAKIMVEDRIAPLLKQVPGLWGVMKRNRDDGLYFKEGIRFRDGIIRIGTPRMKGGLKQIEAELVIVDEYDEFDIRSRDYSSPREILLQRGFNFKDPQLIISSTPGTAGMSLVDEDFKLTDMRERFLKCVHCSKYIMLELENTREVEGEWRLYCDSCSARIIQEELDYMVTDKGGAEWRPTNPDATAGYRGWHINQFHTNRKTFAETMSEFDYNNTKGFTTQKMARVYSMQQLDQLKPDFLETLKGKPPKDLPLFCTTMGIDVQTGKKARFEVTVQDTYGTYEEPVPFIRSHSKVDVIDDNWIDAGQRLNDYIKVIRPDVAMFDIGMDESGDKVRTVVNSTMSGEFRRGRVVLIKGKPIDSHRWDEADPIWNRKMFDDGHAYDELIQIHVSVIKRIASMSLHKGNTIISDVHGAFGEDYLKQLSAEHVQTVIGHGGKERLQWEKKRANDRNEAWDCHIYATAGYYYLGPDYVSRGQIVPDYSFINSLTSGIRPDTMERSQSSDPEQDESVEVRDGEVMDEELIDMLARGL